MADIQASARSIRELMRQQFRLGAYQREYEWKGSHVAAMLKDLFAAYRPRAGAVGSKEYFLGPITTMRRRDAVQLIDGQQRLTTLALVFIALKRSYAARQAEKGALSQLFGGKVRALSPSELFDEPSRSGALAELDEDGDVKAPSNDLQRALRERFADVVELLGERIDGDEALKFATWLLDNVSVAEIVVGDSHDAFAVFDAMNSRGMPLQAMSQFKSWLHRRFGDEVDQRNHAMGLFQATLDEIMLQGPGADDDFVKSWMASRLVKFREAVPVKGTDARRLLSRSVVADIERSGPFFAMEHADTMPDLGLGSPSQFVQQHWVVLGEVFDAVRKARRSHNPDLEAMLFIEQVKFDLDLFDEVLVLAAVKPGSDDWLARVRLVLQFTENVAARWAWTAGVKGIAARNADRLKFIFARAAGEIRGKSIQDLARELAFLQHQVKFDFDDNKDISHPKTGTSPVIHALLARLSAHLDEVSGKAGTYPLYAARAIKGGYEIEHMLPKRPTSPSEEAGHGFRSADAYTKSRQKLGALLLLTSEENNWLRDKPFAAKRDFTTGNGNLLARTLHGNGSLPLAVQKHLAALGIDFPKIVRLDARAVDQRQKAIRTLAEHVWSEDRLLERTHEAELAA